MTRDVRALFFGTPEIAVPSLRALTQIAHVQGVVCQPDRPSGRGLMAHAPPVKIAALELGLPVLQLDKVRDGRLETWVKESGADLALVMAYGRILPKSVLDSPRLGSVNVHASLLPAYRGAAPIQRCILDGQSETGVCLMQMDEGMDTGDVLAERRLGIGNDETHGELSQRLAELAAELVLSELPRLFRGELSRKPQDHAQASYAPPLTKEDERLLPAESATRLSRQVRALSPRPGASCLVTRTDGTKRRLRVVRARELPLDAQDDQGAGLPGAVDVVRERIFVHTGSGRLEILEAQLEGKKLLSAADLARGRALRSGDLLVPLDP